MEEARSSARALTRCHAFKTPQRQPYELKITLEQKAADEPHESRGSRTVLRVVYG